MLFKTTENTTLEEFETYLSTYQPSDIPNIVCSYCEVSINKTTTLLRRLASEYRRPNKNRKTLLVFCSRSCSGRFYKPELPVIKRCGNASCNVEVVRYANAAKQSKSKEIFCSRSCAAIYNNTHKTTGTRRSKLEIWLEEQLLNKYPTLEMHFNRKDEINSELDIFIPSLKLAFELNGIFHYEPIYGEEKLAQIQSNDQRKFQACLEKGIELCIIDSSSLKYFKPQRAKKFLFIVQELISNKLKNMDAE